ncbi:MAG: catalase-related domain-containing protein, partial [Exiguobacterium mexicanum]
DTQRYRIGANYLQLPINCPFAQVSNNQRDGAMPFKQQTSPVNYEPNRYEDAPKPDAAYIETEQPLTGVAGRQKIEKTNDFGQAGEVYRRYSEEEKTALVNNLVAHIKEVRHENTVLLLICNFYRADRDLGARLSEALNVDITPFLSQVTE